MIVNKCIVASVFLIALSGTSVAAADEGKIADAKLAAEKIADGCDLLFGDEVSRCYEAVSKVLLRRVTAKGIAALKADTNVPPKPTATSPSLPATSPVKLTGADLAVQTHKWDGKVVQTRARCFFADKNEYRCLAIGGPRIDFSKLTPDRAREHIETRCDTIQKMLQKACSVTIQFVYAGFDEQDTGGLGRQKLVVPQDEAGYIVER